MCSLLLQILSAVSFLQAKLLYAYAIRNIQDFKENKIRYSGKKVSKT